MTSSTYSASSGKSDGGGSSLDGGGFLQRYEAICKSYHLQPLRDIKLHLTKGVLNFVADKIKLDDWSPLLKTIRYDRTLHFIGIRSRHGGGSGSAQLMEHINTEKKAREMTKGSVLFTKYLISNLIESLAECLSHSKTLTCLQLQFIPLHSEAAVMLSQALVNPNRLQILCLSDCNLTDSGCEELCRALKSSPSLSTLDLTNCQLTEFGMQHIANLIKAQEVSRYNECWKHSLRYRSVAQEIIPGLRRITVNHNPDVGDNGLSFIVEALYDDYWIKAVDMQNCGLTDWGCGLVLKLVDLNKELVVFDVRKNAIENVASLVDIVRKLDANSSEADKDSYLWLEDNGSSVGSSRSFTSTLNGTTQTRSRYVNSSIRMKAASYTEERNNQVDKTLRVSRSTGGIDKPARHLETRKAISTPALALNFKKSVTPDVPPPNVKVNAPKLAIRRNRLTLNDFCPPIKSSTSRFIKRPINSQSGTIQSKHPPALITRQSSMGESRQNSDHVTNLRYNNGHERPSTATKRLLTKGEKNGVVTHARLSNGRVKHPAAPTVKLTSSKQSNKLPLKNNGEMIIMRTETDTTEFKKSNSSLHFSHEYTKQMTRQIEIKETLSLNATSDSKEKIKELFRKFIQIGQNGRDDYPMLQQEFLSAKNHPREKLKYSTSESDNSTSSLSDIYPLDIDYEDGRVERDTKKNVLPGVYDFYVNGSLSSSESELYRKYSSCKT